eukprot:3420926-Lingulodinium_polyedra.AAC.1
MLRWAGRARRGRKSHGEATPVPAVLAGDAIPRGVAPLEDALPGLDLSGLARAGVLEVVEGSSE